MDIVEIFLKSPNVAFFTQMRMFLQLKEWLLECKITRGKKKENPSLYDSVCVFWIKIGTILEAETPITNQLFHSIILLQYSILWTRYSNSQQKYFFEVKLNSKIHFCIAICTCHSKFKCAMYAIIAMQRGAHKVAHSEPKLNDSFGNCLWTQMPSSPITTFLLIQN